MAKPRSLASRKRQRSRNESRPAKRSKTSTERSASWRARLRGAASNVPDVPRTAAIGVSVTVDDSAGVTPTSRSDSPQLVDHESDPFTCQEYRETWRRATAHFKVVFVDNEFGYRCDVCDRLWFLRDLRSVSLPIANFLAFHFPDENTSVFMLCRNCLRVCRRGEIPPLSKSNGYKYPPKPLNLPKLDALTERFISPRIPYMQIRRLRREGSYGIIGQVINVPIDVDTMVKCLPRSLDDDYAFNVNLKKNIIHKSSYISGFVKKSVIEAWLRFLINQPLYKHYGITVDWSVFNSSEPTANSTDACDEDIESLDSAVAGETELLNSRQHTMIWNEEHCLDIAPGQNRTPESLLYDTFAEELSFPSIYLGCARQIRTSVTNTVRPTAYSMCTSEIRRSDRRGVTPQHVLYMAMKILRLRVRDGIQNMFRCLRNTQNITRNMIEDREFVERLIDSNQAFLKTIPNSVQYWTSRKKDLFAMIRQLGKPTAFMTLSANECRWPGLLRILYRLSDEFKSLGDDIVIDEIFDKLDTYKRAHLVAEDPVTCAIYFHKLVHTVMVMLGSKRSYNPFGRHRVLDYFLRIEFQQRGSAHAHILLWLDNDPNEDISENMPRTMQLLTDLCSVNKEHLADPEMIRNQTHAHTFTCTKRGEKHCRFNIPYWPMNQTRVLLPLNKEDNRKKLLKTKVSDTRARLESKTYENIESFLKDINCDQESYLDLIRSTLTRPTVIFKRDMTQIYVNTFNPWIASILNSNMDLQFILDPYSCAAYVVEYVNKSNRGISNLHRELLHIHEANPEFDQTQLMSKVGLKILNSVEMSAQEAAWYLLRQPMSWASRTTASIPTMLPHERYKARKRKSTMDSENLPGSSTDIWTKSIIEKYEERHETLEAISLAQYVAWYTIDRRSPTDEDDNDDPNDNTNKGEDGTNTDERRRRKTCKIIRYRNYDKEDLWNYKREMVTLHMPFRNELLDVIDRNKFLEIYETHKLLILEKRKEFEANVDIDTMLREIEAISSMSEEVTDIEEVVTSIPNIASNDDDLNEYANSSMISAVKPRANVMSKEEYCALLRLTNAEQRELTLEVIHRLHNRQREPIQIFLTGPAGCGKTFTLKALMETYNRYAQQHNSLNNAYIATATTGKAAVGLNGLTVHAAFRLTISKQTHQLSHQIIQAYRHAPRNVNCVIIDEISMCSSHLFDAINSRLHTMTGDYTTNFGGLDLFACGDLKQLPPVNATPVYSGKKNTLGGKALLWQSLDYFPLMQVMRQRDIGFSTLFTKIGSGEALTLEEKTTIQTRFRTRAWCDTNLSSAVVRLYFSNADVQKYNTEVIPCNESSEHSIALDSYTGYRNDNEKREATAKVHKMAAKDTGHLSYSITLTMNYPYMLTLNVDVEDGLVNGAIGKLRCIEHYPNTTNDEDSKRLWLEFDTEHIGRRLRLKYRPHVRTKSSSLDENWVPIHLRSANINVTPKIKCRRLQFPLTPACAMTIHKSQGATFTEIVYDYHKNHKHQLVYVALTRVTSLDGLFLTNIEDDFNFHHAGGSTAPQVREIQNEYKRLSTHRLSTISQEIGKIINTRNNSSHLIIVNINVQSLTAHATDISTDPLISRADFLVVTETWMHPSSDPVTINGFRMVNHSTCEQRSGGVAVYKRNNLDFSIISENTQSSDPHQASALPTHIGDMAVSRTIHNDGTAFILVAIYVHQRICYGDLQNYLLESLREYGDHDPGGDTLTPMILMGDFNISDENRIKLEEFLRLSFRMTLNNNVEEKTTLGGTCIDLTFSRNMTTICKPYISYFSYHRPVFNRISLS